MKLFSVLLNPLRAKTMTKKTKEQEENMASYVGAGFLMRPEDMAAYYATPLRKKDVTEEDKDNE